MGYSWRSHVNCDPQSPRSFCVQAICNKGHMAFPVVYVSSCKQLNTQQVQHQRIQQSMDRSALYAWCMGMHSGETSHQGHKAFVQDTNSSAWPLSWMNLAHWDCCMHMCLQKILSHNYATYWDVDSWDLVATDCISVALLPGIVFKLSFKEKEKETYRCIIACITQSSLILRSDRVILRCLRHDAVQLQNPTMPYSPCLINSVILLWSCQTQILN